jgi:protocatechuate 3,4-dioxygenase beta subunit
LQTIPISRRHILQRYGRLAVSFGLFAPAILTSRKSLAQQSAHHLCGKQTPAQMQGPFFKPLSPERMNLVEPKMKAPRMRITGLVVDTSCKPISGALLDFWQCDEKGQYDTNGFSLRGHQNANSKGEFFLETLIPGSYPGRTPHLHVKVQRKGGQVLTTQLYLPNQAANAQDFLFDPSLSLVSKGSDFHWQFVLPNLT